MKSGDSVGDRSQPSVTGGRARLVDSYWGEIRDDRTDIHTEIGLLAPNLLKTELDGVEVEYEASLNDVSVAEAERTCLELHPDSTELNLDAEFLHHRVPEWWRTHVENDEETEIAVAPKLNFDIERALDVSFPLTDVSVRTPRMHRSFTTDVLESVPESCPQSVELLGREVFTVEDVDVEWREPTERETPVDVEATVVNHLPVSLPFSDLGYEIRMNDVVVGEGDAEGAGIDGSTRETVETRAAIQLERMEDWWPTHVAAELDTGVEETRLEVEFYVEVGVGIASKRITLFEHVDTVETSVFRK